MIWVAVLLTALVAFGAAWYLLDQPPCVKRRVILNLKAEQDAGYEGVLWVQRGGWLTLKDVTAHKEGRPPMKVDGDAVFHRDAILFMQVLPTGR